MSLKIVFENFEREKKDENFICLFLFSIYYSFSNNLEHALLLVENSIEIYSDVEWSMLMQFYSNLMMNVDDEIREHYHWLFVDVLDFFYHPFQKENQNIFSILFYEQMKEEKTVEVRAMCVENEKQCQHPKK